MKRFLNRATAILLCLVLSCSLLPVTGLAASSHPFWDVPSSHWANSAVAYVYDNSLMNGTSPRAFTPNGTLTRAMFVTILGRMDGVSTASYPGTSFSDVPTGQWYSPYVAWACRQGIVTGTGNGQFSPNTPVTREQMAAMIARYVDTSGVSLPDAGSAVSSFKDAASVSNWARDGLELMRRTGILSGYSDGTFGPKKTATRAEAATIFMRLAQAAEQPHATITQAQGQQMVDLVNKIGTMTQKGTTQAQVKNYLEQFDWIETIAETPDGGVSCRTKFGVTAVWTPQEDGYLSSSSAAAPTMTDIQTVLENNIVSLQKSSAYTIKKILILCPYASTDSDFILDGYEYLADAISEYTDCSVTVLKDGAVSLSALKKLDSYDMVWFYSHGTLSYAGNSAWALMDSDPYTMTGEFADSPSAYVLLSDDFFFGRTVVNLSNGRIGVGGNFYKDYYQENQLEGTFFHFGSCNSMRTNKLANGILSRGAAWVEGWTNSVMFSNDFMHFTTVVANLLAGNTIQDCINLAEQSVKEDGRFWDADCRLTGLGDSTYRINSSLLLVSGKVVDSETNQPLSGVRVYLNCIFGEGGEDVGATYTTGADGSFSLEVPNNATDVTGVRFEKNGYNDYLYPVIFAGQESLDIGTVRIEAEKDTLVSPKESYERFLKEKGYRAVTDEWEEEYSPTEYAYVDIDQNGIDELIIIGNDSNGFGLFAVYSYTPEKNVYLIQGMEYYSWNDSWNETDSFNCFGVPSYISKTASLVFDTVRPGAYSGECQFNNLENGVLRYSYQIMWNASWDDGEYDWMIDYANSTTPQSISEEDALSYWDSEESLDYHALP